MKEQSDPSPTSHLYKQRTGRGREGTGSKVGSGQGQCYSSEVTSSLPWAREGVGLPPMILLNLDRESPVETVGANR